MVECYDNDPVDCVMMRIVKQEPVWKQGGKSPAAAAAMSVGERVNDKLTGWREGMGTFAAHSTGGVPGAAHERVAEDILGAKSGRSRDGLPDLESGLAVPGVKVELF